MYADEFILKFLYDIFNFEINRVQTEFRWLHQSVNNLVQEEFNSFMIRKCAGTILKTIRDSE